MSLSLPLVLQQQVVEPQEPPFKFSCKTLSLSGGGTELGKTEVLYL